MMEAFDLNSRVFQDKTDEQVVYTGPSVPELGISNGDTVQSVLVKILERTSDSGANPALTHSDELITTAPTYDLGSTSSASAARITDKSFTYEVSKETDNTTSVSYNMTGIRDSLPADMSILKSGITVQGSTSNRSTIFSGRGLSGKAVIKNSEFPIRLNFYSGVATPDGDIQLRQSVTLTSISPKVNGSSLVVEDQTSPSNSYITQKEFNSRMSAELSRLRQQVQELIRNGT